MRLLVPAAARAAHHTKDRVPSFLRLKWLAALHKTCSGCVDDALGSHHDGGYFVLSDSLSVASVFSFLFGLMILMTISTSLWVH